MGFKLQAVSIVIVAMLVVAGIAGFAGFTDVQAGHQVVVTEKGDAVTIAQPGSWYWFNPMTHATHSIDMRPQIMEMTKEGRGDDAIYLQTNNEMEVPMDVAITYNVTDSELFFERWKSHAQARERLIRPVVRQRAYTEGGAMNTSDLPTKQGRLALTKAIYTGLQEEFEDQPVEVLSVEIRRFHPPKAYMDAIEQKNIEKQEVKVAEQKAEQARAKARGEADAQVIAAEGDAEARLKRAEAEAEANRKLSKSLTDDVLTYRHLQALDRTDTVYMPIGDDGLPVFITRDDTNSTASDDGSGNDSGMVRPPDVGQGVTG